MNNIYCPLTGRSNVEKIGSFEVGKLINDWNRSFAIDISNELEGISRIDLYKCSETGLRFFMPVSAAGSEKLYAQLQKFDWFYMPWKWEHEILFSRLEGGEKILEVGCATGSFVERLCSAGFTAEGIELNPAAVAKARGKNIPVSLTDLSSLAHGKPESFDVVCSFQVLEHVPDPAAFIEGCIALLKREGRLVICVPNNESFLRYQYNLLDMPPHHMAQWSLRTFRALEKLYPLRLSYSRREPLAPYHIDGYLFAHMSRLREISGFYRLFLCCVIPVLRLPLKCGMRWFCRGQSIYVELVKV